MSYTGKIVYLCFLLRYFILYHQNFKERGDFVKYQGKKMPADNFDLLVDYKIWFEKKSEEGRQPLIGEKKIQLLEAIEDTGSIKAAAEAINLDFKTAWDMVHTINEKFGRPLVVSTRGSGGGTYLTPLGMETVQKYKAINSILGRIIENIRNGVEGTINDLINEETSDEDGSIIQIGLKKNNGVNDALLKTGNRVYIIPI